MKYKHHYVKLIGTDIVCNCNWVYDLMTSAYIPKFILLAQWLQLKQSCLIETLNDVCWCHLIKIWF